MLKRQFLRFSLVGAAGFGVDALVFQGLYALAGMGPYGARLLSFLAAATATWLFNRRYTFAVTKAPSLTEWGAYLLLMSGGACINYATFAALLTFSNTARSLPLLAVAAGSIAGLGGNFLSSRFLIFRPTSHPKP